MVVSHYVENVFGQSENHKVRYVIDVYKNMKRKRRTIMKIHSWYDFKVGDKKIVKNYFLILPYKLDGVWKWWERADIEMIYTAKTDHDSCTFYSWTWIHWVNK